MHSKNIIIKNTKDNPGALIIDGHGRADLGLVWALGEKGIPVYLASDDRSSPVCKSKYIKKIFDFPNPNYSDDLKVKRLIEIGNFFENEPVLFSTGDTSLVLISRNRKELEQYYHHHIGSKELIEKLNDKTLFASFADENNLPVPFSIAPGNLNELKQNINRFEFPVMVKPSEKKNWDKHNEIYKIVNGNLKGVKCSTADQLLKLYENLTPYDNNIVIQNYIEGRDESIFSLHIYIDKKNKVKGWFTGQKIRTYPIHRGIGCFQLSIKNKKVYETGMSVLKKIGYTGHAIVQVKRLPKSDQFQIFEINCRFSTWNYLHTKAGINQPYLAYLDSIDLETEEMPEQEEGVRWIDFSNDWKAIKQYRKVKEWTWIDWLKTYFGNNCYALFSWSDPVPFLFHSYNKQLKRIKNRLSRNNG